MVGISITRIALTCTFVLTGLVTAIAGFAMISPVDKSCGPVVGCNDVLFSFGLILLPLGTIIAAGSVLYYRNVTGMMHEME